MDAVKFSTRTTAEQDYYIYIDAVGYDWTDYEVGDNFNPALGGLALIADLYLEGVRPNDEIDQIELQYSFKTNITQEIQLNLFNHTSQEYVNVQNKTLTAFSNETYTIEDSDYYNEYLKLKILQNCS